MKVNNLVTSIMSVMSMLIPQGMLYAQNSHIEVSKNLNYKQPETPELLDNYLFSTFDASGKKVYNLKGFEIANVGGKIVDLKVNPAGITYAVVYSDGKRNHLKVFDTYKENQEVFDFDKSIDPVSIVFSPDSRSLYIADAYSNLNRYDSKTLQLIEKWNIPLIPTKMTASGNGYYIAGFSGNNLIVLNPESKSVRQTKTYGSPILDFDFSDDSSLLAVLLANGDIKVLNTRDFSNITPSLNRAGANAISIHPENKYAAVAKNGNELELINIVDTRESASLSEPSGKVNYVRFLKDGKNNIYLTFNALNAIKYRLIKGLVPNYSKMLREEVIARMEEWSKMAPGETEEQYLARVNEDSRLKQARLFEEEIATRMADDLLMRSTVTLGAYNPSNNTLSLEFDNMPPIYLTVPEKEMSYFMDVSNLEFRNPIYGVTANDKFELVYAEVYNKTTGKSYEFNNRERKSLDYLYASNEFVPIELVRQSGMEEVKLTDIRNNVVKQAKQDKLISDHTNIDVNTSIVAGVNADGKQITNYKVNFKYTVDAGYSAREDFPAGKYHINESNAANSMLRIVSQAFAKDFAQYIKPGKKVIIKITGSADAIPVQGRIGYDGSFGEFVNEPYRLGHDLSSITLTRSGGIRNNEQLAFARAVAVQDYIVKNIPALGTMNTDYEYCVEVSNKKGGEYRRISVEFTFVEAF
ncbi:MAG: WD40 repeat domain-containing protein [Muribaculaceae bacterium]|nr:WD40 repeat domain-containing protein [Muribaculaceae bacterium]